MNEPIYCDLPIDEIVAKAETRPDSWIQCELGMIHKETLWINLGLMEGVEWSFPYTPGAFIDTETKEIFTVAPEDRQPALDALRAWFADREKESRTAQKGEN